VEESFELRQLLDRKVPPALVRKAVASIASLLPLCGSLAVSLLSERIVVKTDIKSRLSTNPRDPCPCAWMIPARKASEGRI